MYKKVVLKNGLKVIVAEMNHMESVSIGVWIGVGGRYESKKYSGMSHLAEHMLFKGTHARTASMLKEAIEGIGGSFNGFTSEEVTCYLVKLPSVYMELGLDILSDMVLNPQLDAAELEKEKYVICEEIKMYMDLPAQHVLEVLAENMWPNHALGRPIAGSIETVKSFRREDVKSFLESFYQPSNMTVVVAGKIKNRNEAFNSAKKMFAVPARGRRFLDESARVTHKGVGTKIFYKDTKQTHIALGFHSLPRDHKLKYALGLLNIILGGNMSSRLFERLREKKALCYDISSSVKKYKDAGAFVVHAGVDNSKLIEATGEIVHELRDIKRNFVSKDELYRAKEYCRGQLLLALEDTGTRMLWLGEKILQRGKAPSVKEIFMGIDKVSIEDIRGTAKLIFNKRNLNFATIGPAKKTIKKKLKGVLTI
ncbi:MAG: pitrilysin family protein [Candidatus Omnitrophota bacterium]